MFKNVSKGPPFFVTNARLNMASYTYTDKGGLGKGHMWVTQGCALSPDVGTLDYL